MDLAARAKPASPGRKLQDGLVCLPCWHLSPSRPFSVFSSVFVGGWEVVLPPPTFTPAQKSLPSPLPTTGGKGRGRGWGGQGSPSVLRLHRVFRLNQENFYYQKEKKRKKNPSGHLSSLPHWDSQDWICGAPGRVAQGWNTLRQEWWGSLQALRQAHFGLPLSPLLSPPSDPPEVAFPAPRPLGYGPYTGAQWGYCTALERVSGGTLAPSIPYPLPAFPRAGHLLPCAAVGTFAPLLRSLCHLPPPLRVEGGADPQFW